VTVGISVSDSAITTIADERYSMLHLATVHKHLGLVKWIAMNEIVPVANLTSSGLTACQLAITLKLHDIAEVLLTVSLDDLDSKGRSGYYYAANSDDDFFLVWIERQMIAAELKDLTDCISQGVPLSVLVTMMKVSYLLFNESQSVAEKTAKAKAGEVDPDERRFVESRGMT
jgi:hypothetical protein